MNRIAILGASRGLGWAVYSELSGAFPRSEFFLSSRKINEKFEIINNKPELKVKTILKPQDFSKTPLAISFLKDLESFKPTLLIYIAGGGPFGLYQSKKWSDHLWALNTTFLYPAELLHHILSNPKTWLDLSQMVFIGSAIAEDKPDPMAASYAAAKHGLRGLITTVQKEDAKIPKILLFSPGYMQTDLLPVESWPYQQGLAEDAATVAKRLIAAIEKNNQR